MVPTRRRWSSDGGNTVNALHSNWTRVSTWNKCSSIRKPRCVNPVNSVWHREAKMKQMTVAKWRDVLCSIFGILLPLLLFLMLPFLLYCRWEDVVAAICFLHKCLCLCSFKINGNFHSATAYELCMIVFSLHFPLPLSVYLFLSIAIALTF